ncbi:MAG TPA: hypothetical protein VJ952_00985 [Opitutales bacterium]|nr:hypothetical protein [Opitutales bacterium]
MYSVPHLPHERIDYPVPAAKQTKGGFALVISLTLMAFLVVLSLTLASLVSVENQSISMQKNRLLAKQNARVGLMAAIGELQAVAGPDQRTMARAELMRQHLSVDVEISDIPNNAGDVRLYWLGVSHSDGTSGIAPNNQPVHWLVSGLDKTADTVGQLTGPLADPVLLIDDGAAETGSLLSAGKVPITKGGSEVGAYAWIVDDETQKAKLAPDNPEVDNENPSSLLSQQRSNLPGYFDLGDTTGLTTSLSTLSRASTLRDLVIGQSANETLSRQRYYDYTLTGYGILADTRNGGLKRDLTAAFENPEIFDDLFPDTSETPYIAMDPNKFNISTELQSNGYIHFGIFRDFYNLKDYINNGTLPLSVISKDLFYKGGSPATRDGIVGPHEINELNHPYGEFDVWSGTAQGDFSPSENYAHNPITPSLAFFQQNAWAELLSSTQTDFTYERNAQTWIGVYNPYNIRLSISTQGNGLMLHGFPQGYLTFYETGTTNQLGFRRNNGTGEIGESANLYNNERWVHATQPALIQPGKTMMFGYETSVGVGDSDEDDSSWSQDIAAASVASVFREIPAENQITGGVVPNVDMLAEFAFLDLGYPNGGRAFGGNMGWGIPYRPGLGDPNRTGGLFEIAQIFYFPFSVDFLTDTGTLESVRMRRRFSDGNYTGTPGVKFLRQNLTLGSSRMQPTEEVVYNFKLRTSIETGANAIRPLIDSNIRAIWNNPKWDTGLNLDTIATHTFADNESSFVSVSPSPLDIDVPEASLSNGNGSVFQTILFDIPREPLVSLGQLQHAAAGRFSYEPSYIVGNSYANIRIPLDDWVNDTASDTFSDNHDRILEISGNFNLYDASYLVNEALFDSYTFTTIPQSSTDAELAGFLDQEQLLLNPRYIPYEPAGLSFDTGNLQAADAGRTNAGHVLVDGAFNINSTSVEAWKVFLSGTKGLPFSKMDSDGSISGFEAVDNVRFPRVQTVLGNPWEEIADDDSWFGFRSLQVEEIEELAQSIVELVLERGPFYNLSQFINRSLEDDDTGKSGLLQAALDKTINSSIDPAYESPAASGTFNQIAPDSTQGAGFPLQLLQGDLLQVLAPYMQTRSDTFKIRSYGESTDPLTGRVISRVWCEAIVQRLPDPVEASGGGTVKEELQSPSNSFGRKFTILSFRWLDEDEV